MRYLLIVTICACEPMKTVDTDSADTADTAGWESLGIADAIYGSATCIEIKEDGNVIVREDRDVTSYAARVSTDELLWNDATMAVSYSSEYRTLWLSDLDACPDGQTLRLAYTVEGGE